MRAHRRHGDPAGGVEPTRHSARPRLLLADGEALVRDGLHALLGSEFRVIASVADFDALLGAAGRLRPAVVVSSVELLLAHGVDGVRALRAADARARLVVVAREPREAVPEAGAFGAVFWVLRSSPAAELKFAVRSAAGGLRSAASSCRTHLDGTEASPQVTPRAAEVVRLIARGKVMKEVARHLGISVRTVAFHKYKTMRDLGLDSSAALVRYAVVNQML